MNLTKTLLMRRPIKHAHAGANRRAPIDRAETNDVRSLSDRSAKFPERNSSKIWGWGSSGAVAYFLAKHSFPNQYLNQNECDVRDVLRLEPQGIP